METKFKETEIGRIPVEWKATPLGSLANITTGTKDVNEGNPDGGYPFFTCAKEHTYSDSFSFDCEALLVAGNANVGRTSYYSGKFEAYQRTYVLSAFNNVISCYLKYYLQKNLEFHLQSNVHKSAMSYIKLEYLKNFIVHLPPLPEQHKIAEILSTVDETIEKTNAVIEETLQLKKGLMHKLFTEGIGHTKFRETKIGRIPEEWRAIQIGDFSMIRRGASPRPIGDPKYFAENGRGWVRIADVTSSSKKLQKTLQYLSELGASRSVPVNPGDLIMSICATIGKPIIVDMEACIHDGFILFSQFHGAASTDYIYYLLQLLEESFVAKGQEGTQKNLNTNLVRKTYVPLPPLDEQHKIAEILSETDAKIEKEKAYKSELEQLKKGLMQVLLTGAVRVKV